jgi:hypothetical protein
MRHRALSLASVVLLWSATTLAAQPASGTDDPDYKEIMAFRLTMPTVQKMVEGTRNMAAAIKNDPRFKRHQAIEAELDKLREKDELTDADQARMQKLETELEELQDDGISLNSNATLSEMAASINKEPIMKKALADAGVDARDYAKFMLAYFQAAMVHGMMKSGLVKDVPKDLAATVNMDNVKFLADHETELAAVMKEFESLKPPK